METFQEEIMAKMKVHPKMLKAMMRVLLKCDAGPSRKGGGQDRDQPKTNEIKIKTGMEEAKSQIWKQITKNRGCSGMSEIHTEEPMEITIRVLED